MRLRIGAGSRDVAATYATQLVLVPVGLAASVLLARALGPADRGALQTVLVGLNEVAHVTSAGLAVSISYYGARAAGDARQFRAAVSAVGAVAVPLAVVVAATTLIVAPQQFAMSPGVAARWAAFMAVYVLSAMLLVHSLEPYWRGAANFQLYNFSKLLTRLLHLCAAVTVYVASSWAAVEALGAVAVAYFVAACTMLVRSLRRRRWTRPPAGITAALFRFNAKGHLGSVAQQVMIRADLLLVASIAGSSAAGLYTIAGTVSQLMWNLPDAIGSVLLSRRPPENDPWPKTVAAMQAAAVFLVGAATIIAASAGVLIPFFFGDDFAGAVTATRLLLPGVVAMGLWRVLVNGLVAQGLPQSRTRSAVLGAIVDLVAVVVLVPRWGVEGAAVGASVAYWVALSSLIGLARRRGLPTIRQLVDLRRYLGPYLPQMRP